MMHEDIIRMMRESGLKVHDTNSPDAIERFVALVTEWAAEKERESCAKVCEELFQTTPPYMTYAEAAQDCAAAIRARGEA